MQTLPQNKVMYYSKTILKVKVHFNQLHAIYLVFVDF